MNHAFTVASFLGDDDKKEDVIKEVTSAVERVTSDYHSGSSSDEENSTRDTSATAPLVQGRPLYQVLLLHNLHFLICCVGFRGHLESGPFKS